MSEAISRERFMDSSEHVDESPRVPVRMTLTAEASGFFFDCPRMRFVTIHAVYAIFCMDPVLTDRKL
jgi:hypothetical protein